MVAPKMSGEGRKANKDMKDTVMMRLAALSLSSTARREISWFATRPVDDRNELSSITTRTTINCLSQSKGQYPWTASDTTSPPAVVTPGGGKTWASSTHQGFTKLVSLSSEICVEHEQFS